MIENFTDRYKKVLQLANQEAQRFNHEYISTEHILLGLVKEGTGVGANVLKNLDIDLRKVRLEVEKIIQAGPDMVTSARLPHAPRAKKVLEFASEESRQLNHNYIGTEHLLLGLIREQEGVASQVLMNLGLTLDDLREETLNFLGHRDHGGSTHVQMPQQSDSRNATTVDRGYQYAIIALPDDIDYIQQLANELAAYCRKREANTFPDSTEPMNERLTSPEIQDLDEQIEQLRLNLEAAVAEQDFEKGAHLRDQVDKLKRQKDNLKLELRKHERTEPPPSRRPPEPVALSAFSLVHLALFRAEAIFKRDALGEATQIVEGIEEGIHHLFAKHLDLLIDQVAERLDFLQGVVKEESLQGFRADLARARTEKTLGLKARAGLVEHVQAAVDEVVSGRPKLVCKVNVFLHGCRDHIEINEGDTVAKLQTLLKERYSQRIEEYLHGVHKRRIAISETCVRVYSDSMDAGSADVELDPQTLLLAIPKYDTDGVSWFPELIGANPAVYR
jgi:ATP-dependent Clp protease ATP-binding subunit ClpA